jgi:hypothetical protein
MKPLANFWTRCYFPQGVTAFDNLKYWNEVNTHVFKPVGTT